LFDLIIPYKERKCMMAHILKLTRDDPVIHLKAYGGVQITGVDQTEVQCEIDAPELATLIEEDGHVYVTVNSSCSLTVPFASSIEIERGMGSVKITHISQSIQIEKVLGHLVLMDIGEATISKVGGHCSVRVSSGPVKIEKVLGNLTVESVSSLQCEKVGGNVIARDVDGAFHLVKVGGQFRAEDISGTLMVEKTGGSVSAKRIRLAGDLRAGGSIKFVEIEFAGDLSLRAGGDVKLWLAESLKDASFNIRSGGNHVRIRTKGDVIDADESPYTYQLGEGGQEVSLAAGGSVLITDEIDKEGNFVGDISDHYDYEESPLSEMIQERVESATRQAEAKIRSAEIRLEQIRERVEKHRGFNLDVELDEEELSRFKFPDVPSPPNTRPAGKKGATDEERLMILKMLQDKQISVDEAETLFRALED